MESGRRILFLTGTKTRYAILISLLALSSLASAQEQQTRGILEPPVERREIDEADIDTEDFEISLFGGMMSVEDFGSNPIWGGRLTYHINEDLFAEASYASTQTEETSFERLSGGAQLLTDEERRLTYYSLNLGYNLFPGESFWGENRAFNSAFYITGGVGSTQFAGDDIFTINFGAGYRLLLTDSIAVHVDFRDHLFDIDILGEAKTVNNLEFTGAISLFF